MLVLTVLFALLAAFLGALGLVAFAPVHGSAREAAASRRERREAMRDSAAFRPIRRHPGPRRSAGRGRGALARAA